MGPRCWSFSRLCAGGFPDGREEVGSVATEQAGPVARGGDGLRPKNLAPDLKLGRVPQMHGSGLAHRMNPRSFALPFLDVTDGTHARCGGAI